MRSLLGTLVAVVLLAPRVASQPLITDRPDFTESAVTVPRGSVQIEGGFTYAEADGFGTTSGPELLVRWSPQSRLEIRLEAPGFALANEEGVVGDPGVGIKVQLGPVAAMDLALIAATSLPLGDDLGGAEGLEPSVLLTAARDLGAVGLGTQIGMGWDSATDEALLGGTLVVGAALADRVGGFAELALDQAPVGPASVIAHGGATFEAAPLVQLDVHAGLGLTETAPDFFIGAGLSLRR